MRNMSLDRRAFIGTSGLLVVAVAFPDGAGAAVAAATAPAAAVTVRPQIVISPSGDVKLWSPTSEMGQGTHTAHAPGRQRDQSRQTASATVKSVTSVIIGYHT